MDSKLALARLKASRIRYEGDLIEPDQEDLLNRARRARDELYQAAIEISPVLTPSLFRSVRNVCDRLEIPTDCFSIFIYSSSDIQGECYGDSDGCVVRISSGLVDLLDSDEFEFVVGHELGHFLLGHSAARKSSLSEVAYFRVCRSQEISCDRIGLKACESVDVALRAMMKTVSGLTSRHLRFDVSAFIDQLRKVNDLDVEKQFSTHPSMFVRARALLWFSLISGPSFQNRASLERLVSVDARIGKELDRFSAKLVRARIENAEREYVLWLTIVQFATAGRFSRIDQDQIADRFGQDVMTKLKAFLSNLSKMEAEREAKAKFEVAREVLAQLAEPNADATFARLDREVERSVANSEI